MEDIGNFRSGYEEIPPKDIYFYNGFQHNPLKIRFSKDYLKRAEEFLKWTVRIHEEDVTKAGRLRVGNVLINVPGPEIIQQKHAVIAIIKQASTKDQIEHAITIADQWRESHVRSLREWTADVPHEEEAEKQKRIITEYDNVLSILRDKLGKL